jgi:hypothetical protein
MEVTRYNEEAKRHRWPYTVAVVVLAGLTAFAVYHGVAASPKASAEAVDESATVDPFGNAGLNRVVLIPSTAKRLDIRTARVRAAVVDGQPRLVVPYAALLYDPKGSTWVYTSPKPRTFIRHSVTIESIDRDGAILSAGPEVGARVATVGVAELFGTEFGVGT